MTSIVPIILFHSRLSLGRRLERTMAAVTVTLVQSFNARLSVTAQKQEEELLFQTQHQRRCVKAALWAPCETKQSPRGHGADMLRFETRRRWKLPAHPYQTLLMMMTMRCCSCCPSTPWRFTIFSGV